MSPRARSIIGWTCALLVSAFTLMSAVFGVLLSDDPAAMAMGVRLGITGMEYSLGIAKLLIVALWLYPRTSTVGFVLIVGYYGGVLATNITHGFTTAEMVPIYVVFLLLAICGWVRHPELTARLRGKAIPA